MGEGGTEKESTHVVFEERRATELDEAKAVGHRQHRSVEGAGEVEMGLASEWRRGGSRLYKKSIAIKRKHTVTWARC